MTRWGMVIDLRNCIGCRACTIVCKQSNGVPTNFWRQVYDGGISEYPDRQRLFLPMSCMHCNEPPCLEVCPTTATYRRPDGIVDIHQDLCVGCGYCIVACPYLARNILAPHHLGLPEVDAIWLEPNGTGSASNQIGVCTKCNFCLPRVEAGQALGLTPGLHPEASPVCVVSCSANALHFGDFDDPDSTVSRLIWGNHTTRLQEDLGTEPSVYYIVEQPLAQVNEVTKRVIVPPKQQKAWKWPAVANFVLGGIASGLYILGFLLSFVDGGEFEPFQRFVFKLLPPLLAGLGFLALTSEAGRPARSRYLLRHLRRSWMSRETLAGAIFIPAAILDWLFPHPFLWGLALAGALGLLFSQGFILYRARGVTAWNVPPIPLLFLTSGLATGSGLMFVTNLDHLAVESGLLAAGLVWIILDLVIWLLYLRGSNDAAFQQATQALRRPQALVVSVGIGHLLPILLLALLLVAPGFAPGNIIAALAGLAIIAGGLNQKVGLIRKAGYLRGIGLKRLSNQMPDAKSLVTQPALRFDGGVVFADLVSRRDLPE